MPFTIEAINETNGYTTKALESIESQARRNPFMNYNWYIIKINEDITLPAMLNFTRTIIVPNPTNNPIKHILTTSSSYPFHFFIADSSNEQIWLTAKAALTAVDKININLQATLLISPDDIK